MTVPSSIRWVVSLAALAVACLMLDLKAVWTSLCRLDPGIAALALLLISSQYLLLAWRWRIVLRWSLPTGIQGAIAKALYANLWNAFTPANLGGDVYRALAGPQGGINPTVVALVRERLLGLGSCFVSYLICWLLWRGPLLFSMAALVIALALGGMVTAILLASRLRPEPGKPTQGRLGQTWRWGCCLLADAAAPPPRLGLLVAGLLSLGAMACWVAGILVVARALDSDPGWAPLAATAILTELVRLVPLSIQGIGVREGAFALGFSAAGLDSAQGFTVAAVAYSLLALAMLLSGALGWLLLRHNPSSTLPDPMLKGPPC